MAESKTPPATSTPPKPTKATVSPPQPERLPRRPFPGHYYATFARLSAILLIGQLAMTTFLLSAGLQHPKLAFVLFFYLTLASLGLNLILFAVGTLLVNEEPAVAKIHPIRYVQTGVFIFSIVALIGFATTTSLLFFGSISSQGAAPATATEQPSGT